METSNFQEITLTTTSQPESETSTRLIMPSNQVILFNSLNDFDNLNNESEESKKKRYKFSENKNLEERLLNILCCAVCLELSSNSIYQCSQGHLICLLCFNHILADARLKNEEATCASCRCLISKDNCTRNLAVEKAVLELSGNCQYCNKQLRRVELVKHELDLCEEKPTFCKYKKIGCQWKGPYSQKIDHQENCLYSKKSGKDILSYLNQVEEQEIEDKNLFFYLINLFSFEKIAYHDLKLNFFRTDEFIQRLFYETPKFFAFNNTWVVKARINDDQKDPAQSCERKLSYQLILKSKISNSVSVHFSIFRGLNIDMKIKPKLYCYNFSEKTIESPYVPFPLSDTAECNKLLAGKFISFRLFMFH